MPFEMAGYIQTVVVEGKFYIGGGTAGYGSNNNHMVAVYDTSSRKWSTLPPYRVYGFAMTVIYNQLVLIGGYEDGRYSKMLGVWRADKKKWMHPYPEMSTARSRCSAAVYNELLVVAGGESDGEVMLSSIEVMNTDTKQWHTGPQMPTPWLGMKTAVAGDVCYFMGGVTGLPLAVAASNVYGLSLPALMSRLHSKDLKEPPQAWKEVPGLQTTYTTPLSISGSLLAVGGRGKDVNAICLYQPDAREWVKVGDLPTPRYECSCAVTADNEVLVAGGKLSSWEITCKFDIARLL